MLVLLGLVGNSLAVAERRRSFLTGGVSGVIPENTFGIGRTS